jgi:hypothetical protein
MAAYTFELVSGSHMDIRGEAALPGKGAVMYKKGDIIQSDLELDVMFKNKFRRLSGPTKMPRNHIQSTESHGGGNMDPPDIVRSDARAKMKLKPKAARLAEADEAAELEEEQGETPDIEGEEEMDAADEEKAEAEGGASAPAEGEEGEDASGEFEDVPDDITVTKVEGGYNIIRVSSGKKLNAKPMSEKGVKTNLERLGKKKANGAKKKK